MSNIIHKNCFTISHVAEAKQREQEAKDKEKGEPHDMKINQ